MKNRTTTLKNAGICNPGMGVDWFNNRRLLEPIEDIPPAECEMMY